MSLRDFRRESIPLIEKLFSKDGFALMSHDTYLRERATYHDGFMLQRCRSGCGFWVWIGVYLAFMRERDRFMVQADYPGLSISHRLGTWIDGEFRGADKYYAFRNARELRSCVAKMHEDFVRLAMAWYGRFRGLEDVAKEYYELRIRPPEVLTRLHGAMPPDPFAWAIYGWMLEELGRRDEAIAWWRKAHDQVRQCPSAASGGQWVNFGAKKGGLTRRDVSAEERLVELLRQSLRLPVEP